MQSSRALIGFTLFVCSILAAPSATALLVFSCSPENDLYLALSNPTSPLPRYDTPADAAAHAPEGSALLVLADQYPARRTPLDDTFFTTATRKHLRLYVEFPSAVPDLEFAKPQQARWERVVVASDALAPTLPKLQILNAHACTFLPATRGATNPTLVLARVAGFDTAVYGLPRQPHPLLFSPRDGWWIATTKLSNVVTARYVPTRDWESLWRFLLNQLDPAERHDLRWNPDVRPAYAPSTPLPATAEATACRAAAEWYLNAGLLVPPSREPEIHRLLAAGTEYLPKGIPLTPAADGSHGILEGFGSQILPDGSQPRRLPLRLDCNAESAMVLALEHWRAANDTLPRAKSVATNLLDYVHFTAPSHQGPRGNPKHPAFGLIAWGEVAPAWTVGNYGDDNARALLATLAAAAALKTDRYDRPVLRALLANLRTTGRLGFRGDRVDVPALEHRGWRHFHDARTINYSPHFESGLWACYLWAHARTAEPEFLDKATTAIRLTMNVYPKGWRWKDNLERARMLLGLAWLVRVQDTPEHRTWLTTVATDLLKSQQPSGALREHIVGIADGGHYSVPVSNDAYGTTETPLQQKPDDPVTDQLYTTGFALLGLHEAAAATGDPNLRRAEDALAAYLTRIQVHSDNHPELSGAWFRAFDDRAWDYRASSADIGWGAWCVEAGWGQAWTAATLALRQKQTTLWDLSAKINLRAQLDATKSEMSQNDGTPWKP